MLTFLSPPPVQTSTDVKAFQLLLIFSSLVETGQWVQKRVEILRAHTRGHIDPQTMQITITQV